MTKQSSLGKLVEEGHTYFWLLECNTQDYVPAKLSSDKLTIIRLDTANTYLLDIIKTCPAYPIIKPEPKRYGYHNFLDQCEEDGR